MNNIAIQYHAANYRITISLYYYIAGSMTGQDEANPVLWLALRVVKVEPSWPLGMARCVHKEYKSF